MRLNIIYKNEMKLTARSRHVLSMAVLYNILLAVILLLSLHFTRSLSLYQGTAPYSTMLFINFGLMSVTAVILALLMTPAASSSVSGERERQTMDILLSTRLTPAEIVIGKMLSSASSAMLLLISGIPVITVTLMYGGIGLPQIYQIILYLAFFIMLVSTGGVMCSCVFRTTTTATVAAYGLLLFCTAGTGILVVLTAIAFGAAAYGNAMSTPLIYTWLLNPAVTYTGIVCRHFAPSWSDWYREALTVLGAPGTLTLFWIPVSIVLQIAAGAVMLAVSIRKLGTR